MPSAFTHAFAGAVLAYPFVRNENSKKVVAIAALAAAMPDLDAIGFHTGVPYESLWGHRGFTHSLLFAGIFSWLILKLFYKETSEKLNLFIAFFSAIASHGLLDALTNGGMGVAFFAPLNNERYFFPFNSYQGGSDQHKSVLQ